MATRISILLGCMMALVIFTNPVTPLIDHASNDACTMALGVAVNALSQQVNMLQTRVQEQAARIEAQDSTIQALQAQIDTQSAHIHNLSAQLAFEGQPVAFLASFEHWEIDGLSKGQILKFDNVQYNAGSGYDSCTGNFTAPSSGTYLFAVEVMRHDDSLAEIALYKGTALLTRAKACCMVFNTGTATHIIHLDAGEAVHVQMHEGVEVYGYYTKFMGMKISSN